VAANGYADADDGEAGEHVVAGDAALFDLGHTAFGDAHPFGDVLLGQAAGAAYLGQPVPDQFVEQFLLAGRDGLVAAGSGDVLGADVFPPGIAGHDGGSPFSTARSFEVDLVALLRQRNGVAVPGIPLSGLIASDQQDAGSPRVEHEQNAYRGRP
jgi:hypothetical protein